MNPQLHKLTRMASAPTRMIIGLMSGTSLDGLDIALCKFSGSGRETGVEVLEFTTIPYPEDFKEELKAISFKEQVELRKVTLLHKLVGSRSAEMILGALSDWNVAVQDVDLIASHGQTIFHAPFSLHHNPELPDSTLQIGDGDHIAELTGIITLSDFRQKHIAAGGEGAPLAVYGDYLLFADSVENRILLNIGGISNFSWLPSSGRIQDLFSTDVGPGNTLMDQFVQQHYPGKYYDKDAEIAKAGRVNPKLVEALCSDPFFNQPFPRTTGPELFNLDYLEQAISASGQEPLSGEDILASLCSFTAQSIVSAIQQTVGDLDYAVYLSGGGMHNPLLVEMIQSGLGLDLKDTTALGINPDAKEAVLFALLANECVAGSGTSYGYGKGIPNVSMGKISLPG
ncbi:anhydro-N-acetylmuramic acid kinase [Pedobacter sp. AW31-3R]|uniref:anhydro-N-acetylmuramic acid kinase n=1 Tax=Pedobacter sp. AW31-3R TaxID=3445781 RepID=UPI003FA08827